MSKKKNKKHSNTTENENTIEEEISVEIETAMTNVEPPYHIELTSSLEYVKNELDNNCKRMAEVKEYLESNHYLYEQIKNKAFGIQKEFADYPLNSNEKIDSDEEYVFFDFENNVFLSNDLHDMPECYLSDGDNIHICKDNGIYVDKERYSSSRLFLSDKKQIDSSRYYISAFEKILDNIVCSTSTEKKFSYFCMLPEAIDVFNTKVRRCLNTAKGKIISIPKSVAVTYCILDELNIGDRYCVIDMDGLHPIITQLSIGKDSDNKKVILREGFLNNSNIKYSYILFANEYLDLFEKKYSISFTDREKNLLIYNKMLDKVFSNNVIKLFRPDGRISVVYDDAIFKQCVEKYVTKDCSFPKCNRVYLISSIMNLAMGDTLIQVNNSAAFSGLERIRSKLLLDENAIIWKERLPKVSLEVIDDNIGRFKVVNLIDEDNEGQNIRLSVDEEIELPFRGTITLQKGKKEYYLPLEREIYSADINSAKEAYFYDKSFPLDKDVPVELVVKYNYMSESPIKLYARPKIKVSEFHELPNTWVDPHEIEVYSGPIYNGHPKEMILPSEKTFIVTLNSVRRFISGKAHMSSGRFTKIMGLPIHEDLVMLSKAYFFLRSTFDTDCIGKSKFKELYSSYDLVNFYENVNLALETRNDLYGSSNATWVGTYKQGLLRPLSDIIVPSWYYDKNDSSVLSIYNEIVKTKKTKNYIRLSRCINSKEDDIFNVFDKMTTKLCDYYEEKYMKDERDERAGYIRTLSQNCWFNKNWLKQFYESPNGPKAINLITSYIYSYLKKGKFRSDKEYRDIMEFLVCLTMSKNFDRNLFNPNSTETKELLQLIKESYDIARNSLSSDVMVSRLEMQQNQGALFGYHNYIYILIIILSGEGQVNLVGYHDEA